MHNGDDIKIFNRKPLTHPQVTVLQVIRTSISERGFTVTAITQVRSGVEIKLLDQRSLNWGKVFQT